MYVGRVAPPSKKIHNKVYYLEGEHRSKTDAVSQKDHLKYSFGMDTIIRKVKNMHAVYAR